VGSRAGLDAVVRRENPSPCQESNPWCPARSLATIQSYRDSVVVLIIIIIISLYECPILYRDTH